MNKILTLAIILVIPCVGQSQTFDYLPAIVDTHQIVNYTQFTLSYNEHHEQPDWVAYELTKDEATIQVTRSASFSTDNSITTGSATTNDFTSTGFDKGHLSPAADNKMSEQAYNESYLLSNMSPQLPTFNQGIWKRLEAWVRDNAVAFDTVYVVTGPVFIHNLGTIGSNDVTIPGFFYKALLRFDEQDGPRLLGFLFPHVGAVGRIEEYAVPVNTIETLTGLDLFPGLTDNRENFLESQRALSSWLAF